MAAGGIRGGIWENRTGSETISGGIRLKLSDITVKAFISKAKPGNKLADGGGLHLFVTAAGGTTWRIKYRVDGKEKLYSIGRYPQVTLAAARVELLEVKALLREGKDPVTARRVNRAARSADTETTFQAIADDWLAMKQKEWSAVHYKKSARAFERDVYPRIGKLPIAEITPAVVAKAIEDVHKRDVLETATRILQHLNGVFRYAQAKGQIVANPATAAREILPRKKDSGHMPALLDFPSLGDVLRRADAARLSPSVRMAHRLLAFSAARIGNIVDAEWREFDLDAEQPVWTIPRKKMKVATRSTDHRIPLSPEIVAELQRWRQVFGRGSYVFPSPVGGKHIGRESIEKAYRVTLGLDGRHAPHGWRSAFSTLARDQGFPRDAVELSLDHAHDNDVARAYDRGERFEQRVEIMKWWGTNLSAAERGGKVIPMPLRGDAAA